MSESTGPRIDDVYWFEWSKQHLDSALERRDAAFGKLQNLALWLWGIYTTFAATGFALSAKTLSLETTLAVGAGSVLLIAVYWACVWGQMPVPVEFDPRSPTEIGDAHYAMIRKKDARLVTTMLLSLAAAGSVAFALLAAGAAPGAVKPRLDVAAVRAADGAVDLAVTARVKAGTQAVLSTVADPGSPEERREPPRVFLSTGDGVVQAALRVPAAARYRVGVAWQDDGVEQQLVRVVAAPGPASR
jgi:hypothetical protein